jgi:hypothetical protein
VAASSASPAVQSANEIKQQMNDKLPSLNRAAERLYGHWVLGLSA